MSTVAREIATVLQRRGYDYEIAHLFAERAWEAGRLATSQSLGEAVAVVTDMLTPTGVNYATKRIYGSKQGPIVLMLPLDARRSWLVT